MLERGIVRKVGFLASSCELIIAQLWNSPHRFVRYWQCVPKLWSLHWAPMVTMVTIYLFKPRHPLYLLIQINFVIFFIFLTYLFFVRPGGEEDPRSRGELEPGSCSVHTWETFHLRHALSVIWGPLLTLLVFVFVFLFCSVCFVFYQSVWSININRNKTVPKE